MNFLIFRDFFQIFLIFYEFIWIYIELKRMKNMIYIASKRGSWRGTGKNGIVTWQSMNMPRGARVCVRACVYAPMCAHECN